MFALRRLASESTAALQKTFERSWSAASGSVWDDVESKQQQQPERSDDGSCHFIWLPWVAHTLLAVMSRYDLSYARLGDRSV